MVKRVALDWAAICECVHVQLLVLHLFMKKLKPRVANRDIGRLYSSFAAKTGDFGLQSFFRAMSLIRLIQWVTRNISVDPEVSVPQHNLFIMILHKICVGSISDKQMLWLCISIFKLVGFIIRVFSSIVIFISFFFQFLMYRMYYLYSKSKTTW